MIVATLGTVGWTNAMAQFPQEGPTLSRKVRNLGMGNVGVALRGTHDSSPFYNPAGLNDLEKGRFQFFSMTGDVSTGAVGLIGDITDFADNIQNTDGADRTRVFDQFIQDHTGEFNHVRWTLDIFNYARKDFAAGVLIDEKMNVSFRDQSFPRFEIQNLGDLGMYIAGSHGFWDQLLQVGATLKPTIRFAIDEVDQEVTYSDIVSENSSGDPILIDQFKKIKDRRFGLGVDVGAKTNLAFPGIKGSKMYEILKPQVGVSWQDMGSPGFDAAPNNEQSISAGAAVHPDIWKLKNAIAVDFRDLNQERDFLTKLHFGVESKFPWILTARAGLSQGYFTLGATFDLWFVKIDGAWYKEEVGVRTREAGDNRWAATLSFNI